MVSRAEQLRKNRENSKFKIDNDKGGKKGKSKNYKAKGKGHLDKKDKKDEMDKKIESINRLHNLNNLNIKDLTKFEGDWSYFVADYFTNPKNKQNLNINQLRDIHQLFKNIEQKLAVEKASWDDIKLDYNLIKLNINLKYERHTIPPKFYQLIYSLINIVDNISEDKKIQNLNKIIVIVDAMVGYYKYLSITVKNHQTYLELILKINSNYLLNMENNNEYVNDTKKIAKNISTKDIVTIYQLRKIFNVYKTWENRLKNQWSNIEDEYYKFYPKLAYMTGRGLISNEFFKLLIHCMDVVDNGDNKENVLKFKNFIKYYEAIISYYTYQNLKKGNKEIM